MRSLAYRGKRSLKVAARIGMWSVIFSYTVLAQQQMPHAGYAYPAGGRQGTTFEITVGGQFLDGVKSVMISGPGVQASVADYFKPLTPAQATQLRDQAKELSERPSPTAADRQKIAEIRAKLVGFVRRPTTPAIAETVRVQVALAADVALGERELRLVTPNGLTNPVMFCIGQLPEVSRSPAKGAGELPGAQAGRGRGQARPAPDPPMEITLPVLVNGQITPGGVDRYRFQAAKGQHVVVAAKARELLPYISDAVPGWFQATLSLHRFPGQGSPIRRPLPLPSRPGPLLRDSRGWRIHARGTRFGLPRARGFRLPHRGGRAAIRHGHFSAGRTQRSAHRGRTERAGTYRAVSLPRRRKARRPGSIRSPRATGSWSPIARRSRWIPCRR